MDQFEQELARMMRDGQEDTPYEARHRDRLRVGVRARQRARTAWTATGSVLAVTGLGVGLVVLTGAFTQGGPSGPQPRPLASTGSAPMPSTVRPVSTAEGAPMPFRRSAPGPATVPTRISVTGVAAPRPGSSSPAG
ncbi:cellulase [Kitasatospora sp. NBC_01539]|uniref:cellulase n=1 Tax=Kitasatospora sp. NBC_01539 TaxID=2903577 RepID=UPI0038602FD9